MLALNDPERRAGVVIGGFLVILGVLALLGQVLDFDAFGVGWPLLVVAVGIVLFASALAVPGPGGVGLAIPGGIVTMVGVVLAFQNATGLWATWAYAWALVAPGGVGLGMVAYGLLTNRREIVRGGWPPLFIGVALFLGFGLFFEGILGLNVPRTAGLESILAGGFVLLGALIIGASLVSRRGARTDGRQDTPVTR